MKSVARALLLAALAPLLATAGELPKPVVTIASPGTACVAPPAEMRRKHMEMLRHQRDRTLRAGERGNRVSLNGCIDCHAGKDSGSVVGRRDDFCESCHAYASVKLDCFECHQGRRGGKALAATEQRP